MNQKEQDASVGDYGFLMFLTLLNVMNFVDRQLLASFANWIVPDLGLTNTEFGLLTGLIFIFFYSVAGVFMGVLADRVNRTRLIAAGLALWSALIHKRSQPRNCSSGCRVSSHRFWWMCVNIRSLLLRLFQAM